MGLSVRKVNGHRFAGNHSQQVPVYGRRKRSWSSFFFDLQKASDSVPHYALLDKLRDLQLNEFILKWICDYLMQRKQRVVVNGQTSETLPVLSGVPQGSVIGPLLFLIYIDGVMGVPLSEGSELTVYADDILLYRPITCQGDFAALQEDTNKLDSWIEANYLQFNISKCKYMVVSQKRAGISYTTGPPSRAC